MQRLRSTLSILALVMIGAPLAPARAPLARAADPPGIGGVFGVTGGAVRDTNGDGWPDAIAARVIVAGAPTAADVEAATNIAARLGFETMALTLPTVVRDTSFRKPSRVAFADPRRP